ncbi:M15 family metallopeptidase [Lederbergia panacisoli]|uniref:M15 family metallopeptidase n=1 Tax=Lederbergia panacisoli TaxID=1255251 RepID=UPI00214C611D|nr:M15 family metallopeptidase [Lederbergia panacisoli]MCR2822231.1 M15 family metallopeptidase [Lederbergia panacisoli]
MKLNHLRILPILLLAIFIIFQSGCSFINRGNIDRSNLASNENGGTKLSETIMDQEKSTVENPLQEEKKEDRTENSKAGNQIKQVSEIESQTEETSDFQVGKQDNRNEKQTEEIAVESKENRVVSKAPKAEKLGQSKKTSEDAIQVVGQPEVITVLVNKQNKLPDHYAPKDLVYPNVRFIFSGNPEKKKMRKEAARALEKMFAGAEKNGILLAGASGYRSQATQEILYNSYVRRDGKAAADRYSAIPSHSEHQTGLAMDISGINGKCAAMDCFGGSPEADWLAEHSHEYGFIVRYPKGKEHITGYQYEPWHMRYIGIEIAKEIFEKDITLEEYFDEAIPINAGK